MGQQIGRLTTFMRSENRTAGCGPPRHLTRPWPSKVYSKDDLKPYKMYRILYGERKFAREFPKETQTLSFTDDLPTEIRLEIYTHLDLRDPDGFFELWGSAAWLTGHGRRRHYSTDGYGILIHDTFKLYAKYKHKVRLMRLCKKVHGEVAELFYGGHNFRFSCVNGFQMMAAWLHNIQPTHFQYLRHITVHIPIRGRNLGQTDRCIWSKTKWDKFEDVQRRRGMRPPKYKYRSKDYQAGVPKGSLFYDKAAAKAFKYLGSIPGLRKLELIVPQNYDVSPSDYGLYGTLHCQKGYLEGLGPLERVRHVVEDHIGDDATWAQLEGLKAQVPDLAIALVVWKHACCLSYFDKEELWELMRITRWLAAYAKLKGYDFGHARWNLGAYHVQYDEDKLLAFSSTDMEDYDDVSEPPDVLTVGPDDPRLPKGSALACDSAPDDED